MLMNASLFVVALLLAPSLLLAESPVAVKEQKPFGGKFLELSKDGLPWAHPTSSLRFPQRMADFQLERVFQADSKAEGYVITYKEERRGLRFDCLVFPPEARISDSTKLLPAMKMRVDRVVDDLTQSAKKQGYYEESRSEMEAVSFPIWERDDLPMMTQSFVLKAAQGPVLQPKPDILHTINLSMFEDLYVQSSLVMSSSLGEEAKQIRGEVDKLFMGIMREPALTKTCLKLAVKYVEKPDADEGKKSADALLELTSNSLTLHPHFPGEAITPCLNQAKKTAPGTESALLRAYSLGSLVVLLQDGSFDEQLTEGARMMTDLYASLQKQQTALKSAACEELGTAVKEGRAALYLREKMVAPVVE